MRMMRFVRFISILTLSSISFLEAFTALPRSYSSNSLTILPTSQLSSAATITTRSRRLSTLVAFAKKKGSGKKAKGFGKGDSGKQPKAATTATTKRSRETPGSSDDGSFTLQSIEASDSAAQTTATTSGEKPGMASSDSEEDDELPPEERTKRILREKYGLRTLEEQQLDAKQLENYREQQRRTAEWKKQLESEEDLDIMTMLPAPVLVGVDRFLKAGLFVSTLLFVTAGIAITVEAYYKATGGDLPPALDRFVVDIVEPNFTKGLLILLGFSISLGLFASAQLASRGAQYKEGGDN